MNRLLDVQIARDILGWKYVTVPPDPSGKNESEILTPDGQIPEGVSLPVQGKIGEAFLVPLFSYDYKTAMELANKVNPEWKLKDLPNSPEGIALKCYDYWKRHKS